MEANSSASEMWERSGTENPASGFIIAGSVFLFYLASLVVNTIRPHSADQRKWRWKNISISFLHSCITGPWALLCFIETPRLAEDLIGTYSWFSYALICISLGYFVYDMLDLIVCQRTWQSLELLGHHVVILVCYGVAVTTHLYVGYAVVGLLVEVNSILLHLRQLLQICGIPKGSGIYRFTSLVNLATFIVFRISLLAWMTRWIVINKDNVPLVFYTIGSIGLAIMTLMNIILFYRLLRSDFFTKTDKEKTLSKVE